MIDRKSRYRKTPTVKAKTAHSEEVELLDLRVVPPTSGLLEVVPTASDRLDHLAARFYREPTRFWRICDATDHLDPVDVLVPGAPVVIPPDK